MPTIKTTLFIYTETSLHAGTGTGLGAVDLPIQREKHTDYPIIQASGVKGALRDTAELKLKEQDENEEKIKAIFGSESSRKGEYHAGAVSPSDARILLFPVRALNGVFMWVTCPSVLSRFVQDMGASEKDMPIPDPGKERVLVSSADRLIGSEIMLEEYAYSAEQHQSAVDWANYIADTALPAQSTFWQNRIRTHLAIIPDTEFRDFVKYATDIVTRIHIDSATKTVKDGQLFTQELLPADSILYSMLLITQTRNQNGDSGIKMPAEQVSKKLQDVVGTSIQIGADETVGRGRVRLNWQVVQ